MQNKWKDLIPFYVAGTLADDELESLEAYLIQCGDPCQDEIEEWRTIASATWQYTDANTPELPPLSNAVLATVAADAPLRASGKIVSSAGFRADGGATAPVYARPESEPNRKVRRATRVPLTMVAAFMTMVIFGGILLTQLKPEDLETGTIIQLTEVEGNITAEVTEQFGAQVGIVPDSGILATPTPFAPQPTATFVPTSTPFVSMTPAPLPTLPPNSGGGVETGLMPLNPTGMPPGTCIVRNDTQGALTTYRDASFDAEPRGILGQGGENRISIVFNGWYMLSYGNWVYGDNVTVIGDCSQVWTATPTAIGDTSGNNNNNGAPNCIVRNAGTEPINMYQWPDYNSPINGRLNAGREQQVYVGGNGWYQVFYAQWVNANEVMVQGADCNNLWIPTPTFSPDGTPTPVATFPAGQTVAVVTVGSISLRQSALTESLVVTSVNQGTNLAVLGRNDAEGAQRWYWVQTPSQLLGWIPSTVVDVIPNDQNVSIVASRPTPTPTPVGHVPTPTYEDWSHISTIIEHGCGGVVGQQETISTQLLRLGTEVQVTYPATGTSFTLSQIAPNAYAGSYGAPATVQVDLSFSSSTTYTANETVTHESGCIVRSTWSGTKQ